MPQNPLNPDERRRLVAATLKQKGIVDREPSAQEKLHKRFEHAVNSTAELCLPIHQMNTAHNGRVDKLALISIVGQTLKERLGHFDKEEVFYLLLSHTVKEICEMIINSDQITGAQS